MTKHASLVTLAFIALPTVALCGEGPETSGMQAYVTDPNAFVEYAETAKAVNVEVLDNPFSQNMSTVQQTLISDMRLGNKGPTNLKAPQPQAIDRFHVVVAFGPKENAELLCSSTAHQNFQPHDGVINVNAAFCLRGKPITSSEGQITNVSNVNDAQMTRLMKSMARDLFPAVNYQELLPSGE